MIIIFGLSDINYKQVCVFIVLPLQMGFKPYNNEKTIGY